MRSRANSTHDAVGRAAPASNLHPVIPDQALGDCGGAGRSGRALRRLRRWPGEPAGDPARSHAWPATSILAFGPVAPVDRSTINRLVAAHDRRDAEALLACAAACGRIDLVQALDRARHLVLVVDDEA